MQVTVLIGNPVAVLIGKLVDVQIGGPVTVLRARQRRLRIAVVVRHSPVRLNRRLWLRLAVAVPVRRGLELRPVSVLRRRSADGAAVGVAADVLGAGVGVRRRGAGGVSAVRPRGSSVLVVGGHGDRATEKSRGPDAHPFRFRSQG